MILSLVCAVIGLCFAIVYSDSSKKEEGIEESVKIKTLLKNKTMILIMLTNLLTVGAYFFLQAKATLLIQYVCESVNIEVAKISLIVSGLVFGSHMVRVISNFLFPKIYNKVKNKSRIVLALSLFILISNICFAIGGNINANYILKLIIITLGFFIVFSVNDIYSIIENKIIETNLPGNEQKQAFVLANIYGKFGCLLSNAFALLILGFMPLNILYICMLAFSVGQIFICIPLSKYFKS